MVEGYLQVLLLCDKACVLRVGCTELPQNLEQLLLGGHGPGQSDAEEEEAPVQQV